MSFSGKRNLINPYLEYMPDPQKEDWNPCLYKDRHPTSDVQHFLSCLARNNSLYIVANFGDKQPCSRQTDKNCPTDNQYQFNTDVVFDPNGKMIAKYHKLNLYFEFQFDYPNPYDVATFDTPFGRFGVFTCFDIMFKHPATDLIKLHNIGNIAFPTAWMDSLPFLAAVQFHSAFAAGLGVNFLAANIHLPARRFQGSGIYTAYGAKTFYYNKANNDGHLMVAELPINNQMNIEAHVSFNMNAPLQNPRQFQAELFHDIYNMVPLDKTSGEATVCHNGICCKATYSKSSDAPQGEYYALGAVDNVHVRHGGYYIQVCTVVRCPGNAFNKDSCSGYTYTAATKFDTLKIQGNFSTPYIYPELLMTNNGSLRLGDIGDWRLHNSSLEITKPLKQPLVEAGLVARVYERDTRDYSHFTLLDYLG